MISNIMSIRGTKTAIMYGANLSYAQTQRYLKILQDNGFLEQVKDPENGRGVFVPTEKGKKLLELLGSLSQLLEEGTGRESYNPISKDSRGNSARLG